MSTSTLGIKMLHKFRLPRYNQDLLRLNKEILLSIKRSHIFDMVTHQIYLWWVIFLQQNILLFAVSFAQKNVQNLNQLTTLANMGKITVLRSDELIDKHTDLCQKLAHISREVK